MSAQSVPGRTTRLVHDSALVQVDDLVCRRPVGTLSEAREFASFEIALPRAGAWCMHVGDETVLIDPNSAAFFAPGFVYRNSHPAVFTANCTILTIPESTLRDILLSIDDPRVDADHLPHAVLPLEPDVDLLHRELLRVGGRPAADEVALRLVARVLRATATQPRGGRSDRRVSPTTARHHAELVEGARGVLNRSLTGPVTLAAVARALDCSPFHLSRVFSAGTGTSVYRYHTRLRLLAALERVQGGALIADAAHACGFADHSHLTRSFRRVFGVVPSSLRGPRNGPFVARPHRRS